MSSKACHRAACRARRARRALVANIRSLPQQYRLLSSSTMPQQAADTEKDELNAWFGRVRQAAEATLGRGVEEGSERGWGRQGDEGGYGRGELVREFIAGELYHPER